LNPTIGREKYAPRYNTTFAGNLLRPLPEAKKPPCENACPLDIDVNAYILMASRGQFDEAYRRLKVQLPFPAVIGRVCPHPCETECNRDKLDDPIAINSIKRFVSDYAMEHGLPDYIKQHALPDKALPVTKKEKVAIAGSGPAGLSAAYFLTKKGYKVTVFEALSVAGGMMAIGVPEYRLPKKIVKMEIDAIKKMGVEIKTDSPVGKGALSLDNLKKKGYSAIFLAVGAQRNTKLTIPGEDAQGVVSGLDFLKDVNMGKKVKVGTKVAVIGGGNVAIDAARMSLRLGAGEVTIYYRRTRAEMPAFEEEIVHAIEEGAKIDTGWTPGKVLVEGGKASGIELMSCTTVVDKAGNSKLKYDEKNTRTIDADMIITAIGQAADLEFLPGGHKFKITKSGTVAADSASKATGVAGVFAGGDVARGPATMIEAIADGKNAAIAIDCYLRGEELPVASTESPELADIEEPAFKFHLREYSQKEERSEVETLPVKARKGNFKEVNLGFADKETCIKEARRCLTCRCTSFRY
jgi:NADH-quinone oxidoreductase subunit F